MRVDRDVLVGVAQGMVFVSHCIKERLNIPKATQLAYRWRAVLSLISALFRGKAWQRHRQGGFKDVRYRSERYNLRLQHF